MAAGVDQPDLQPDFTTPFPRSPILCAELEVPAEWLDFNAHMNIGYYLLAFDRALDVFFESWMDLNAGYARRTGMGSFVLQSHMHFLAELRQGERFQVFIQLLEHDHKRWRYIAEMREAASGRLSATCEQIAMNVDHRSRRSTPLPEPQRLRLAALMEAHRDLPRPAQVGAPLGIRRKAAGGGVDEG